MTSDCALSTVCLIIFLSEGFLALLIHFILIWFTLVWVVNPSLTQTDNACTMIMYVSLICKCLLICFRNILVPFYSNESLKDEKIAQLRFILVPLMHAGSVIAQNKYTKSFWKILTPPPPLVMALWKEIFLETGNPVRRSHLHTKLRLYC